MRTYNVLVTGISGIIGYGVAEALRECKYPCKIVGVNVYEVGGGEQWCDIVERGPFGNSEEFPQFIYDMIVKHQIDLVFPTVELEIRALMKHRDLYAPLKAKFVLNNQEFFDQLDDKALTYKLLKDKIVQIPTIVGQDGLKYDEVVRQLGSPFIIKKCISSGSQGIAVIDEEKDFDYWTYKYREGYICQKKIRGEEYTLAVFGLHNGEYVNMIVFERTLGHGTTMKARCIYPPDPAMVEYVDQICRVILPVGPTNVQLLKEGEQYLLIEVNSRVSASTSIRFKFGVNEAEMCIEYFLMDKIPDERIPKTGSAIRYLKDLVTYDGDSL